MRRAVAATAILAVLGAAMWVWASGASGRAADSFGILRQDIEIMDQQRRLLESVEVTTQSGSVWIRDDVPARLSQVDWDDQPTNLLEHTDKCEA